MYQELWDKNTKYRFGICIFLVPISIFWLPIDITNTYLIHITIHIHFSRFTKQNKTIDNN